MTQKNFCDHFRFLDGGRGERLLPRRELRGLVPVSDMTIWRWERDGLFPRHLSINDAITGASVKFRTGLIGARRRRRRLSWSVGSMSKDQPIARRTKKRTYNTRLIKRDYSYFVWEIADLLDLHPNAVRRWIKVGLVLVDDRRPSLIYGGDLIEFLDTRQGRRKQKGAANELFCFRCRRPRHPRFGRVELEIRSETRLDLSGVCEPAALSCTGPARSPGSRNIVRLSLSER